MSFLTSVLNLATPASSLPNTAQQTSPLLLLPKPVRLRIYILVLRSSTGCVLLSAHGDRFRLLQFLSFAHGYDARDVVDGHVHLGLISTCRQTYNETKGMLWDLNTVVFAPEQLPCYGKLHIERLKGVKNVVMRWNISGGSKEYVTKRKTMFGGWEEVRRSNIFVEGLSGCKRWLDEGTLERLTLLGSMSNGMKTLENWEGLEGFLNILREAGGGVEGDRGYLSRLGEKRKVVFEGGQRARLVSYVREFAGEEEILEMIHRAFGGELEIDGVMLWREGERVGKLGEIVEDKGWDTEGWSEEE